MRHTPQLQRRHFEFIAATIASINHATDNERDRTARAFVRALKPTNPNFNADRFLKACGVDE